MKLFEIVTTSLGESYVRSYSWAESEADARAAFARLGSGYEIAEVGEVLTAESGECVFLPSDSGFGARVVVDKNTITLTGVLLKETE